VNIFRATKPSSEVYRLVPGAKYYKLILTVIKIEDSLGKISQKTLLTNSVHVLVPCTSEDGIFCRNVLSQSIVFFVIFHLVNP
jgi:hypothetical protein